MDPKSTRWREITPAEFPWENDALDYAHRKRVFHRALSPYSALVIDPESSTPQLKLFNWQTGAREREEISSTGALTTTARLADRLRADPEFLQVAELLRHGGGSDQLDTIVRELVLEEGVPCLPVLRYTATGLRKRAVWEKTWALQRLEDAIDARTQEGHPQRIASAEAARLKRQEIGDIPVPSKYSSTDFLGSADKLRGKLDVPRERFILYPPPNARPTRARSWAGPAGTTCSRPRRSPVTTST
ncbi:MAG: hypothetical protein HY815_17235 [Candidatus Riflebacteria bacterium]|nr:hypothetical protein [Candidatus Riflebacteria bacterium]